MGTIIWLTGIYIGVLWILLLDDNLKILDFGLSKKITPAIRRKWDNAPNMKVTYFMLKKGLQKYGISVQYYLFMHLYYLFIVHSLLL